MRSRHPLHLLIALIVATAIPACGDGGGGADDGGAAPTRGAGATVTIATFAFEPDPIEVELGTTITFVNEDAIDHTVTAGTREAPTPEVFDGSLPEQGTTYELTLDEPGTYAYFCEIHEGPGMTGSITVS